jgi:hypothetical protein
MKIYIAHTYGRRHGLTDKELENNALSALNYGRMVILKGHNPFIPNLWHWLHKGWKDSPDEDRYFQLVSEWIKDCDALFAPVIPKWENSGVHREIKIATALGKAIYYRLEDIP